MQYRSYRSCYSDHPQVGSVVLEAAMDSNLRRWAALVVVCFGQLMIMLDGTIVNVALPYIQRDLGFSQAGLTWVVNAYLIAYGSFLLVAGRMGDLIRRRKGFLAGGVRLAPARGRPRVASRRGKTPVCPLPPPPWRWPPPRGGTC